jgi:uncharacterized protein
VEQRVDNQHPFWGPFATLAWGILILLGLLITQVITVVVYVALTGGTAPRPGSPALESLKYDGRLLSWSTFATAIICGLAIVIVVKLKRGSKLSDYLGLIFPNLRQLFFWLVVLIAFIGISDGISVLLGKPTTPEFMVKAYSSLASPWILWLALLVAAPLFEELFFRGFLIKGLSASVLSWYGAVIISSVMWAAIHIQYDLYGMATILVLGFILGTARIKSGSTILTMLLHSFTNLVATGEVIIYLRNLGG